VTSRLRGETYEPITDGRSVPLQLRIQVDGKLLGFYREDRGEKLLIPDELLTALREEMRRRAAAEDQAAEARERAEEARETSLDRIVLPMVRRIINEMNGFTNL
jgi:hypothetical protein